MSPPEHLENCIEKRFAKKKTLDIKVGNDIILLQFQMPRLMRMRIKKRDQANKSAG